MGYNRCCGDKYGIVPNRKGGIFSSILFNLPFICRLYTRKIKVSLTSRTPEGAPIMGTFSSFRIYKKTKTLHMNFMVHAKFYNVLATVDDACTGKRLASKRIDYRNEFWVGDEYAVTIFL